jgi:hypothetical protein
MLLNLQNCELCKIPSLKFSVIAKQNKLRHEAPSVAKFIEMEHRMMVTRGKVVEWGGSKVLYIKGTKFAFCKMKTSRDWCNKVKVTNTTEL